MEMTIIQKITIWAIPLIFAVTLHEVAHGFVASWCGDQTARLSGRLSLNPIKHIDPIGTLLIPGLMLLVKSPILFGWAKPVPVDARNLRNPRRDMALVALSGSVTNILMAFFWGLIAKFGLMAGANENTWLGVPLLLMGGAGMQINIWLGLLNLIPLPPLDGGKVMSSLLPPRAAIQYQKIEPYGFIILLVLLFSGGLATILMPLAFFFLNLIAQLFGIA